MSSLQERPPPTTAAIAIASAIVAGITGFFLGQASSIGLFKSSSSSSSSSPPDKTSKRQISPVGGSSDSTSDSEYDHLKESGWEEEDEGQEGINDFGNNGEECKMVLVVRTDLGMTKGKIGAQCGHAVLACYKAFLHSSPNSPVLKRWERLGQAKIALQSKSEDELEMLQAQAMSLGLVAKVIHDAGRTQIASGSATVLGIGPGPKSVIDGVTGHLKLL